MPMVAHNFILIISLCCCFDWTLIFKLGRLGTMLQFWGQYKDVNNKKEIFSPDPPDSFTVTNHNKVLTRLIWVYLGAAIALWFKNFLETFFKAILGTDWGQVCKFWGVNLAREPLKLTSFHGQIDQWRKVLWLFCQEQAFRLVLIWCHAMDEIWI